MSINWIPAFTEESHSGTKEVTLLSQLLTDRNVFIQGEINAETANNFLIQIMYLKKSNEPVNIFINSGGGEVNAGMFIYDLIQSLEMEVNIYCTGMAASMAAVILAGGQDGHRYILPHSKTMIHEPLLSQGVGGSASSIKNISDSILQTMKLLNGVLSKHTGRTMKELEKATSFDHYMDAEESVAFGICDKVVDHIF